MADNVGIGEALKKEIDTRKEISSKFLDGIETARTTLNSNLSTFKTALQSAIDAITGFEGNIYLPAQTLGNIKVHSYY